MAWAKIAAAIGIKGFVAIGLAVALGIAMWRADAISNDREAIRNNLATERANHAVTRNSVAILEDSLAKFVGAGNAARAAKLASMEAQAKDSEMLELEARAMRREMETWNDDGSCTTPGSILGAGGL